MFRGVFNAQLKWYSTVAGGLLAAIHSSIWPICSHTGMRSWTSAETLLLSPSPGEVTLWAPHFDWSNLLPDSQASEQVGRLASLEAYAPTTYQCREAKGYE